MARLYGAAPTDRVTFTQGGVFTKTGVAVAG